ncbi:glucose-1-phosphate adenylyltransferase [Limnoglobus roseus]|uniref:Glucose-1-phosphate adenylyltransferase n=1 Tax=Limnoglobus roseus TaxID=2598579 RepID=A0A5C1A8W6_9BACT|nr:glucose-1-phosphate adenylyltransferase [Limnoglobus roseus]QEL15140.1 glucose-1-phosphate adenylyltransferase [Limnoglobus roseus]
MPEVLSLILGGGRGSRLFPLTKSRAKPAVPVGGKYRLIDIPISNCINSRLNNIYVLTQFLSVSLHRHIANTYKFDMFSKGFVEILAAQQAYDEQIGWYQGTADAVRQNIAYINREEPDEVLILSGDQLYRMDYQQLIETHRKSKAEVTIAAIPVPEEQTAGFGLMRMDDSGRVLSFTEKPKTAEARKPYYTPSTWIEKMGIPSKGRNYLANMGIYLFNTDKLIEMLNAPVPDKLHNAMLLPHDFGSNVFPNHVADRHIQAHLFDGFWEDLGTIKSYHETSLALGEPNPPFDFFSPEGPIFTRMRNLPASRINGAALESVTIADGCVIGAGSSVKHSLIGVRSVVGANCHLKDVVMIGSDGFETQVELEENRRLGRPHLNIGEGCRIERAMLDKDCRIGQGVRIRDHDADADYDDPAGRFHIRDGIVCVPRGAVIPDGLEI